MADRPAASPEFAIRLDSLDDLFYALDAAPVADRALTADVRGHLLDQWERLRDDNPRSLVVIAPRSERDDADESSLRRAIHKDLLAASGPLRIADPLPRRERIAARIGIASLFACIVVSSALDRISDDVIVEGISQGVLVLGWVALWAPASRLVIDTFPHLFNRRRYAEFAEIEVEFRWA